MSHGPGRQRRGGYCQKSSILKKPSRLRMESSCSVGCGCRSGPAGRLMRELMRELTRELMRELMREATRLWLQLLARVEYGLSW